MMGTREPRHGDPFDNPDIPGDSGPSEAYDEATRSPEVKAAILRRRLERIPAEATAGRAGWTLIENEGALFRGFSRGWPQEVWSPSGGWTPYADAGTMKPIEWGSKITEAEAAEMMREWIGQDLQRLGDSSSAAPKGSS